MTEQVTEQVNHPEHYNELVVNGKPVETIDLIEAFSKLGNLTAYEGFLLGNVVKYLTRFEYKGVPTQDLKKAKWYLEKLIAQVGEDK